MAVFAIDMSLSPSDSRLSLRASRAARGAAIAGTRAFVAEEAFGALVTLLVRSKAVSAGDAAAALHDVAARLVTAGADHAVWQTNSLELEAQATWLRGVAANVLECGA